MKERRQKEDWRGPGSNIQPSDNGHDALPLIHGGLMCERVKSDEQKPNLTIYFSKP